MHATSSHAARLARLLPLALAGLCTSASCTGDEVSAPVPPDRVARGTWGGDGAGFIVAEDVAHVHIGCTFGDIGGRIALDADGRFTREGTYQPRAYPVVSGPLVPATFTGRVQGRVLTITALVNDTVAKKTLTLGPVTVTLGTAPRLGPCPICTVVRRR